MKVLTAWEALCCKSCGHEYIRAAGRQFTLPCGKCGANDWIVFTLLRGAPKEPTMDEVQGRARIVRDARRRMPVEGD
jgi:hypothetical protein